MIEAATQLADSHEKLSDDEKREFAAKVNDIVRETPQAKASAVRIRALLGKMARGTASALRDLMVDVISETAKKIIWPSE